MPDLTDLQHQLDQITANIAALHADVRQLLNTPAQTGFERRTGETKPPPPPTPTPAIGPPETGDAQ